MSTTRMNIYLGVILFFGIVTGIPSPGKDSFTINIVHTNDMHARFEETSKLSGICDKGDINARKCYGGFARIATLVRKARNSTTPTLFLIAGDTYQGSIWYTVHKSDIVTRFLNILQPNATSLGNHEFDDGIEGLEPFIKNAKFPILATNLNFTLEPKLNSSYLRNSTILEIQNKSIGIIGYLTPETTVLARTGKVIFKDEIECIRQEAKTLKSKGVNIIIALGHSGIQMDRKIAREVEDVDLVIGGHTNTFLYNGTQPDAEPIDGFYPLPILQTNKKKTAYVVQAYAYTKYLGNLTITFDKRGDIIEIKGNPILVNGSIEQAPDILAELDKYRPAVNNVSKIEIGDTRVLLDGIDKHCRREECNFGNLITDAIVDYVNNFPNPITNARQYAGEVGWTDAAVAVYQGGGIRSSISKKRNDKITGADIETVLPFTNIMFKVSMTGREILSMLEHSVSTLQPNSSSYAGHFLQFSGIQVMYDLNKNNQSKVVSVLIRCAACRVPSYTELKTNQTYQILMPNFLQEGGDGYSMLKNLKTQNLGTTLNDMVIDYLKNRSPVYPGVEWRINFHKVTPIASSSANSIFKNHIGLIILLLFTLKLNKTL